MESLKKVLMNAALGFLIVVLLIYIYYPTLAVLVSDWSTNPDYSHGFIIPFITLYMVWDVRKELACDRIEQSFWGFGFLFMGVALQVVAKVGSEHFLTGVSMIIVLWGLILYLGGAHIAKLLAVPVAYLFFMIPLPSIIWNKFSLVLKLYATEISVFLIKLTGHIALMQEGNIIHLSNGTLEVADACSGLRSLISMLAIGVLIAVISRYSLWKRWALVVSAIPIAIIANIIRLVILVFIADRYGFGVAEGFLHTFSGLLVFAIGVAMLSGVHVLFSHDFVHRHAPE